MKKIVQIKTVLNRKAMSIAVPILVSGLFRGFGFVFLVAMILSSGLMVAGLLWDSLLGCVFVGIGLAMKLTIWVLMLWAIIKEGA